MLVTVLLLCCLPWTACSPRTGRPVVVYTSVDQVDSEAILRDFARRTGIRVRPVFDVEATKTVGLVQRILSEASRPRADVFWSSEPSQTLLLARRGLLAPYRPRSARGVPAAMRSPEGLWTAVGCRVRVLLVNTNRAPEHLPRSINDLLTADPRRTALSDPLFGTMATHAAALFALWGPERAERFFRKLAAHGTRVIDGNAGVKDLVASGRLDWGLTDSDDACRALAAGAPVRLVLPGQDGPGTLLIPGTVALIRGGPHPAEGRKLVEYLVSAATERWMIRRGAVQLSVRPGGPRAPCLGGGPIRTMDLSLEALSRAVEVSRASLREIFTR